MNVFTRCVVLMIALLGVSLSEVRGVIKANSPLQLFVRDATQIVQVRVTQFVPERNRLVFDVEQDIKGKIEQRNMPVVWKVEPDSKWEGVRTLPRLLKCFGPDQQAILFINDTGGFWHNAGAPRKNPIAFGFTNGSWFCMESTRLDNGKLLWKLAQGEPYLRTTFKGTTAELNKVLVDHLAGKDKLPEPVKAEPGFGPEYQPKTDRKDVEGLKLPFPEVKGWELAAPRPLPPASGGYTVGYNSEDRVAVTIYVYNRGLARIPDDLTAQEVQRELAGAKGAVLEAKRLGLYQEVREEASGESTLGGRKDGPRTLYARFRVQIDKQDTLSEIYVLPYRNHFIKVRVTRAGKEPESVRSSLDRLFAGLSKVLAK